MDTVTLTRIAYLKECTLGWLSVGDLMLATIERPWLPNPLGAGGRRSASCIPDGSYVLRPHASQKYPASYALINHALGVYYQPNDVPAGQPWGRSAILIHQGNRVADVVGCIAVGESHGMMGQEHAVLASALAMNKLRAALGREHNHRLIIRPTAGTQELAA